MMSPDGDRFGHCGSGVAAFDDILGAVRGANDAEVP